MSASVTPCPIQCPTARPTQETGSIRLALVCILMLMGCTDFPDLNGRLSEADADQPYPALVPAEEILANAQDPTIQPDTQTALDARVAALEQRAATLRNTGLDPEARARMQAGVTPLAP